MKLNKIISKGIACLLVIALFHSCKKEGNNDNGGEETISKMTTVLNLHQSAAVRYQDALTPSNDSLEALVEMANWVKQQPEVEKVTIIDNYILEIQLHNGLNSSISVMPVAADGQHMLRGWWQWKADKIQDNRQRRPPY